MTHPLRIAILIFAACGFANPSTSSAQADTSSAPGLKLTIESKGATDVRASRLLALRVPAGTSPSPFLEPGPFKAVFQGSITLRIRDTYSFSAIGRGSIKLTINDEVALEATGEDLSKTTGSMIRLKKGKNTVRAEYTGPADGDAWFRLMWSAREFSPESVPPIVFSHDPSDATLVEHAKVRTGRALVAELRCLKCHTSDIPASGAMPELAMDAPSLEGVGGRLNQAWVARWIANPKQFRPTTAMPKVHLASVDDADDIAAFLATEGVAGDVKIEGGDADDGARLFTALGCVGCHVAPGFKPADDAPARIPLAHVADKWKPAALVEYLKKPQQHYQWSKMPDFRLSDDEAKGLALYLTRDAKESPATGDAAKGKVAFQSAGCINCHTTKVENTFKVAPLVDLKDWKRGCLAKDDALHGKSPDFALTDDQRAAIEALAATQFASLKRDTAPEFAERQIATLNCTACHVRDRQDDVWSTLTGEVETLLSSVPKRDEKGESQFTGDPARPPLTWVGEKLRPQWMATFIEGKLPYKPRPWLEARMPGFGVRGKPLAEGLAVSHGCPPEAPPQPQSDPKLAEIGQKLVGKTGGFSCVQCHAINDQKALAPFEAPAINFAHVTDRLNREYYDRWVYNPQRVLPGTRMPQFADAEGKTAIKDMLNGDARAQYDAIWNYLLQGETIQPPK